MGKVAISPEARKDIIEIGDYVAFTLHNRSAARKLMARIQRTLKTLEKFPESGSVVDYAGPHILYRFLVCGNYLIFYHLSDDCAYIDRVLYGRRDYLVILFGDQLDEESE